MGLERGLSLGGVGFEECVFWTNIYARGDLL